jgi:hypothetical protein
MDSVDEGVLWDQHRNRCVSYTAFVGQLVDLQDKMLAFGARASQSVTAGKRSRRWPRKRNSVIINQFLLLLQSVPVYLLIVWASVLQDTGTPPPRLFDG